jgi:hypothetical protein
MSTGPSVNGGGDQKSTETNSEYARYLQSPRWRTLARAVRIRAKGKCEICWRWDGEECAHLTYERIFNERMTDVLWVCKRCHRELDDTQRM